ncbi:MAG: phosphatidate cytidylyltransferase [Bryobacteraceae bacterium]|nr:phosphatidate cytidylyltransferase [Bryobacteraceae bacterium]
MKRIATGLVLLAIFTYVVIWSPGWAFAAALAVVAGLGYREYENILGAYGLERLPIVPYAMGLVVLAAPPDMTILILLGLVPLVLALRVSDLSKALPSAAGVTLGVIYCFGPWRVSYALREISEWWLFFALSLNWVGDTAAYYGGRAFGRNKLAPRVSPGKTWEGTLCSVAGSLVYGLAYAYWLLPSAPPLIVAVLAIAGNIAGQLGDLVESALKRGAGLKDSGTLLPGHGGWLDRIDASLFSIPVVYHLLAYVFPAVR